MSESLGFDTNQSRDRGNVQVLLEQLREAVIRPTASGVLILDSDDLKRLKTFTPSNFVQEISAKLWSIE
jgi:hypothetical protein